MGSGGHPGRHGHHHTAAARLSPNITAKRSRQLVVSVLLLLAARIVLDNGDPIGRRSGRTLLGVRWPHQALLQLELLLQVGEVVRLLLLLVVPNANARLVEEEGAGRDDGNDGGVLLLLLLLLLLMVVVVMMMVHQSVLGLLLLLGQDLGQVAQLTRVAAVQYGQVLVLMVAGRGPR